MTFFRLYCAYLSVGYAERDAWSFAAQQYRRGLAAQHVARAEEVLA